MSESDVRQVEFQKAMNDQASVSARAEAAIKSSPYWFHAIELAPGITTPGRKLHTAIGGAGTLMSTA